MTLNMLVSHPKVDVLYNPNLDDSECVSMSSESGCFIQSIFGCGISYPLQLQPGLHRGDQTGTGDETEGTLRCLREGDDGEVSCSGECMGESPSDRLGGDHSAGPWQRTGAVGEGGPTHSDDTLRGALQPRWRTESPWLLDCCDEEAGREEQSSPTFDLQ